MIKRGLVTPLTVAADNTTVFSEFMKNTRQALDTLIGFIHLCHIMSNYNNVEWLENLDVITKGLVTSDDVGSEDVRVPGGVSVNHDQDWVSHNQDPSLSSSEAIVRLDDTKRGSGCQCGEHECHEECQCLRVEVTKVDERMKGKLLLVIKTCCQQNITTCKTNTH